MSFLVTAYEIPAAWSAEVLVLQRQLLLSFADVIIPGHGAPFRPGATA
jgi:hypothetical protein